MAKIEKKDEIDILRDALSTFGIAAQMDVLVEECAELTKAICKYKREPVTQKLLDIFEEFIDVQIMLDQMNLYFGCDDIGRPAFKQIREKKLRRLRELISGHYGGSR